MPKSELNACVSWSDATGSTPGSFPGAMPWISPECHTHLIHKSGEIITVLHVTFKSPMIVWKSPPSALHSLSITVSIFSGVNRNLKRSHWELLGSINEAPRGR